MVELEHACPSQHFHEFSAMDYFQVCGLTKAVAALHDQPLFLEHLLYPARLAPIIYPFHTTLWVAFFLTSSYSCYLLWNGVINISLSSFCPVIPEGSHKLAVTAVETSCFYLSFNSWNMHLILFSVYSFPFCFLLCGLMHVLQQICPATIPSYVEPSLCPFPSRAWAASAFPVELQCFL